MKTRLALAALLILVTSALFSQDKIYRKNGKVVEAKIIEVSTSEIKYKEFKDPDGPVYVLETDYIDKIVYANGKTQSFVLNIKDPERYKGQRDMAIKIDFLGPLFGYSQFTFEKSQGVGKSYELSLGIIGLGKSWTLDYYDSQFEEEKRHQAGVFVGGGYKFGKMPDFILFGKTRMSHLMQGTYVRPMAYFGNYNENYVADKGNNVVEVDKQNVTFGAVQLELGEQWIFGDAFLVDLYWGFGYGFDNKKMNYYDANYPEDNTSAYNYANARLGTSPGFSMTFAVKVGWLLKTKNSE